MHYNDVQIVMLEKFIMNFLLDNLFTHHHNNIINHYDHDEFMHNNENYLVNQHIMKSILNNFLCMRIKYINYFVKQ